MHIANPIYDVVFKYLMEDNDIAKLIISTIIGEDIVALDGSTSVVQRVTNARPGLYSFRRTKAPSADRRFSIGNALEDGDATVPPATYPARRRLDDDFAHVRLVPPVTTV